MDLMIDLYCLIFSKWFINDEDNLLLLLYIIEYIITDSPHRYYESIIITMVLRINTIFCEELSYFLKYNDKYYNGLTKSITF